MDTRMLGLFTPFSVLLITASLKTANCGEPVYKAVGEDVVLTPGPVPDPITIILWKHGQDIAMEWDNGDTEAYRQFKVRGNVNVTTGALTITGLTLSDSGIYTADINNKFTSTTELLVISRVSKPTVSTRCEADNCVFTCDSDTTNAEPVTYSWFSHEKPLVSTKELRITKEESAEQFSCTLRNPVSNESSESVQNPFLIEAAGKLNHILIIICPLLFLILLGGLIFVILNKRKKRKKWQVSTNHQVDSSIPVSACQYVSVNPDPVSEAPAASNHDPTVSLEAGPENKVEVLLNHVPASAASLDNSGEREAPEGSSQDPKSDVSSETGCKDEFELLLNHVPASAASLDNSGEREGSSQDPKSDVSSETGCKNEMISEESPNLVQTNAASADSINETEVPEASNQDPTSDAAPESSSETGKITEGFEDPGTATQNHKTAESTDNSNKTGGTGSVHETHEQDPTVQQQASDVQNETKN